jgi:hypothetical protein
VWRDLQRLRPFSRFARKRPERGRRSERSVGMSEITDVRQVPATAAGRADGGFGDMLQWKGLQRWNYGAFALTVVHGIAYQLIERRALMFVGLGFAVVLGVVSLQVVGLRRVRR